MKAKFSPTRDLRNRTVIELYRLIDKTNRYHGICPIACIITQIEAPVHYISFKSAMLCYDNYFKHNIGPHFKKRYRQELYISFLQKCKYWHSAMPAGTPSSKIVLKAIQSKAPHVGLDPQQIMCIIKRFLKNESKQANQ